MPLRPLAADPVGHSLRPRCRLRAGLLWGRGARAQSAVAGWEVGSPRGMGRGLEGPWPGYSGEWRDGVHTELWKGGGDLDSEGDSGTLNSDPGRNTGAGSVNEVDVP